jgi:hypothetical protein
MIDVLIDKNPCPHDVPETANNLGWAIPYLVLHTYVDLHLPSFLSSFIFITFLFYFLLQLSMLTVSFSLPNHPPP